MGTGGGLWDPGIEIVGNRVELIDWVPEFGLRMFNACVASSEAAVSIRDRMARVLRIV